MTSKLKKRTWVEYSGEKRDDTCFDLKGKTLLTDDFNHSKIEFHLNNLFALFTEIDEKVIAYYKTVREIYVQTNKNIDQTISQLECIQSKSSKSLQSPSNEPKIEKSTSVQIGNLDVELNNEVNSLDHYNETALQKLKSNASVSIDQAIELLGNCKSKEEARNVLENLLNYTLSKVF